jgi:acyl-CoA synthetase (AMP-forming)/AMP-acid ligase II
MTSNMAQFSAVESKFLHPDTDRIICVLPLFHMFGLSVCLHTFFYFGIPLYIFPRFDLVQFCETIERYKVTYTPLVPPIYLQLVEDPVVDKYDLTSWKLGLSAAAPLSVSLIKKIKEKFPQVTIKQGYGLTETSPVVTMELSDYTSDGKWRIGKDKNTFHNFILKKGSSGILVPNLLAKLVDENGKGKEIDSKFRVCLYSFSLFRGSSR